MINLNTKITSDHHFGHKNIVKYESKRKKQIENFNNHDDWLLNNWNSQIKKNDNVLHLGDIAFKGIQEFLPLLNGNIDLILGNHDRKGNQTYKMLNKVYHDVYYETNEFEVNFNLKNDLLFSGLIQDISGIKILFSHYPVFNNNIYDLQKEKIAKRIEYLEELYTIFNCDLNIHGHTHSNPSKFKNSFNVSLDATNYKIFTLKEILEQII